ncbi:MAG: UvrD-helicase domain-containing protein [Alphaproteobacteria bacterium]|nr:UvrD-helicase domain-containing protein [Alphaproteobacteria bacterium]
MFAALETPVPTPHAGLLANLNPQQAQAVQHTEGPLLVLAGAGTGKTAVLTRRIAYLLLTGSARPHEILAVTFTNKAAREMAERTEKLIGYPPTGMWLGTFHRLGVRFLRQHAEAAGLQPGFNILDTDDVNRVVTQLAKDFDLDTAQFPPRLLASMLSRYKDYGWGPAEVPTDQLGSLGARMQRFYEAYQAQLKALNAVDFGDLLLHPLRVLEREAAIREHYQSQLKYLLVDEYQDTNVVQYRWLQLLAAQHQNLCVVGDDDQSIYSWRGAQVANILRFEHDFKNAVVIRLEQNYRSTGHILAAANGIIGHNTQRHGKQLWTDAGDGDQVELHATLDDREEARFVAETAARHVRQGGAFKEVAALVRTAAQTRSLEEALIRAGVPYIVVGGLKFYERKEIRDALAYLRLVVQPRDDLAFLRIVNVPRRGVGETTLATITAAAREHQESLLQATVRLHAAQTWGGKLGGALGALLEQLKNWQVLAQTTTPDQLAERVLEESGYLQMLRDDKDKDGDGADGKARLENLKELLRALQEYPDVPSFLDHVALVADTDTAADGDNLSLMTMHAAKGLEFPLVFLPGFEEGLFPNQRALNEEGQKGLEEERRLAYVALTRARRKLVISYANARRLWGQFLPGSPSRFLAEIPAEHLKVMNSGMARSGGYGSSPYGQGFTAFGASSRPAVGSRLDARTPQFGGSDYAKPAAPLIPLTIAPSLSDAVWQVGEKVFHQKFGNGRLTAVEGKGESARLTVNFTHAGTKTLVASLAKLEKVG